MYLKQTHSTSTYLRELLSLPNGNSLPDGFTVYTDYQTSGRGQQGASWESEDGKNLLFSTLFRLHDISVQDQFRLSELVTLGTANVLERYTTDISIKWPNDIYQKDCKITGILIEHAIINGQIAYSIAGIGINVNQEHFHSHAPNPISLKQITGKDFDRTQLLNEILTEFQTLRPLLHQPQLLKEQYMARLYRRTGWHMYLENQCSNTPIQIAQKPTNEAFIAKIKDITDNGCLILEDTTGKIRTYHFKEVRYVIPPSTGSDSNR